MGEKEEAASGRGGRHRGGELEDAAAKTGIGDERGGNGVGWGGNDLVDLSAASIGVGQP